MRVAAIVVLAMAGSAGAQVGWIVTPIYEFGQTSVNPMAPSVHVRITAYFSPPDFAFAAARWDVVASEPGWSAPFGISPWFGFQPGVVSGPEVLGSITGQIHFPPTVPANPANPVDVWEAVWRTGDFRARTVPVVTRTGRFDVYLSATSPAAESRLEVLTEGRASILVTPAPGAGVLLFCAGALGARRRRVVP